MYLGSRRSRPACCMGAYRQVGVMEIRRYIESDHDEVWNLHNLALNEVEAHGGNGPWDDDFHHVATVYLNNGGEFLVGICEGKIVAIGALMKVTSTLAEIKRMRVHPLFQGRGHGQAILDALQARAVEMGYTKLCLDTTVQQIAAQKLYLKNGFLEVGRTQKGRFECLLFEKQIKPISRPHPTEHR